MKTALLSVTVFLFCTFPCPAQTLRLATMDYPPYTFAEENTGEPSGLIVDIVSEAFYRMEKPFTIEMFPWSRALRYLKNGKIDAVFHLLKTRERMVFCEYNRIPLYNESISLFVTPDSDITFDGDLSGLQNHTFGVRQDFNYGPGVSKAIRDGTIKHLKVELHPEILLLRLINRKVDIIIGEKNSIPYIFKRIKEGKRGPFSIEISSLKRLSPDIDVLPTHIGFTKKNNLTKTRDHFDRVLLEMKSDGTLKQIFDQWGIPMPDG